MRPRGASVLRAAEPFRMDQTLEQYVGKNAGTLTNSWQRSTALPRPCLQEKTKIVAKLAPKASGAPVREPRIDENTHKANRALGCYCRGWHRCHVKAMMAHYYRKQEESKKLQEPHGAG